MKLTGELGDIAAIQSWALVPVKSQIWAKTRLSGLLSASERAQLQWAMLQDVLDQLQMVKCLAGIAIVCPDNCIQDLARLRGIRVFSGEPNSGGLNAAVAYGTEQLRASGADVVAILPGDVPLLYADDIDRALLCAVQENVSIVVPDQEMDGTNALVFRADRAPRFQFGKNSFQYHLADRSQGLVRSLPLASIARDIDWPDDLDVLRQRRGQGVAPRTNSALAKFKYMNTPVLARSKT